jgi:glycerol-3-phosphate dehydrogenase (NAD(P)+)
LAVLGAGSWGTALAILIARRNQPVLIWDHNLEHVDALKKEQRNTRYLPDFKMSKDIIPMADLPSLTAQTREFVIAVPSHAFRATLSALRENLPELDHHYRFCWGTKGLEASTGKLMNEVFDEIVGKSAIRAVLSGPSFAREVAANLPTALTVAAEDPTEAKRFAGWFRHNRTRIYTSGDLVGVQLAGAIKNVMAIAVGISDGLNFGANARAALITRGLTEMIRLGTKLGGQADTFIGLAGIGDLVLTCTDDQSRNRRVGLGIGRGNTLAEVLGEIGQAAEGVDSTRALYQKSQDLGVEMPITEQVYRVLFGGIEPMIAVQTLLDREPKPETG